MRVYLNQYYDWSNVRAQRPHSNQLPTRQNFNQAKHWELSVYYGV